MQPLATQGCWDMAGTSQWRFLTWSQGPGGLGNIKGFLQMQSWSFCVPALDTSLIPQSCLLP